MIVDDSAGAAAAGPGTAADRGTAAAPSTTAGPGTAAGQGAPVRDSTTAGPGTPGGQSTTGAWRAAGGGTGRQDDVPDWWPYAAEFPAWHVWRGINGLVYGRRLKTSPPLVVRGEDAVDLRDAIRREEFRRYA